MASKVTTFLAEIRQLEGERQSLVYNHHHELIAASDTISAVSFPGFYTSRIQSAALSLVQMKTRAEGLDVDLDLLRAAFSEISRLTAEVSLEQIGKIVDSTST